ncbi:iron-sulfur cluster biosynthesis [Neobacillus cucumis]|uniref:iron-sulfur cluster biosynthesis n=1 Tax=Neobacillus cucumis TaxID=1740721 RepID=UPI002852F6B8|nr:iron-sulfur cluster biosynthesis [Neobacillus cucumis]MDR4945703.1 iron-sulfur cluster biosynthesis [Neobacillus cucumis]
MVTEAANEELQKRLKQLVGKPFIRLQMRKSCFLKVKVTLEGSIHTKDTEIIKDGLHIIIDEAECHYFNNKTLDFIPDQTGFKEFEII